MWGGRFLNGCSCSTRFGLKAWKKTNGFSPHQAAEAMIQGFRAAENWEQWEEKAREAHEVPRDRLWLSGRQKSWGGRKSLPPGTRRWPVCRPSYKVNKEYSTVNSVRNLGLPITAHEADEGELKLQKASCFGRLLIFFLQNTRPPSIIRYKDPRNRARIRTRILSRKIGTAQVASSPFLFEHAA
jgi:hypothetical protein